MNFEEIERMLVEAQRAGRFAERVLAACEHAAKAVCKAKKGPQMEEAVRKAESNLAALEGAIDRLWPAVARLSLAVARAGGRPAVQLLRQ